MRHPQHRYFPQFRCNSAKRYRRPKLREIPVLSPADGAIILPLNQLHYLFVVIIFIPPQIGKHVKGLWVKDLSCKRRLVGENAFTWRDPCVCVHVVCDSIGMNSTGTHLISGFQPFIAKAFFISRHLLCSISPTVHQRAAKRERKYNHELGL